MPDLWMDVDTAVTVPVNIAALIDDTDFKTREESVVYNQSGLDLLWNFVTTAGVITQTAVTPTDTAGVYDWTNVGNGYYKIEIPASGGGTINNDTEGFGWFSGFATGILPWRGPIIGFRAAGLNNVLIDSAYSTTRGLAGTALPDAAADAAGGLPISDLGGLDLDGMNTNINDIETDTADMQPKLGTITDLGSGATIGANLVDIEAQTDDIGAAGAGLTALAQASVCTEARLSELDAGTAGKMANQVDVIETDTTSLNDTKIPDTLSLANINAQVDTALSDIKLQYLVNTALPTNWATDVTANSALDYMADDGTAVYDRTTDSLQGLRDHVGDGTNLTEAGGTGDQLTAVPWNSAWDTEVESEVNDGLVVLGLDHLVGAAVIGTDVTDNSIIAKIVSKSATADWDSFVNTTDSLEAARDKLTDIETDTDLIDDGTSGLAKIATDVAAVLVDSNELQTDWTNGGRLDLILDAVLDDTDLIDDGTSGLAKIATDAAAVLVDTNELQTDWVNGGRLDLILDAVLAMLDNARTEPGQGAPPVNPDAMTKIDYLYKSWRNKKDNDGSTTNLYDDAGTTVDQKQTTSEAAGTVTKGEWVTGP